ncbi:MAG TPA: penicillin-binding protein, partial [Sphingomonas sp.]
AQIGRPVAGKTGTTSSSKDGWFLGFSSGLTTGVWMGRDDAKPIAGLHGGTAPAKAFADFMKPATASRPIEQFETQVTLPEWQLEPDEESYFGNPDNGMMVDPDGNPIATDAERPGSADDRPEPAPPGTGDDANDDRREPQALNQDWIDRVTGRPAPREVPANRQPRDQPRDLPRVQSVPQEDLPNQ